MNTSGITPLLPPYSVSMEEIDFLREQARFLLEAERDPKTSFNGVSRDDPTRSKYNALLLEIGRMLRVYREEHGI